MKLTKEGIAVIEGDEYLSRDIETQGRLDVARDILMQFSLYIPKGAVVIDVGACLGDYTATFSEFVGPQGRVYAFEPNPPVYECLRYNMRYYPNVICWYHALGDKPSTASILVDPHNIGASRLVPDPQGRIEVRTLDSLAIESIIDSKRLDFIKLDAEGYEPYILDGAIDVIKRCRPVILTEINPWMLGKLNFTVDDIYKRLDQFHYHYARFDGPHGDVLAVPKEKL